MKKKINDIILCIRFPFLYVRNRWTNRHYNNWTIHDYLYGYRLSGDYGLEGKAYYLKEYFSREINEMKKNPKAKPKIKSYFYFIWFHVCEFIYDWILPIFHCIPSHTELDDMPIGWRNAFGIQLCKELRSQLIKEGNLFSFRIVQIKEKFGLLRIYTNYSSPEIQQIIQKYEDLSWETCIDCGKPSTKISDGWISPYCNDCYPSTHLTPYMEKVNGKWEYAEDEEEV